MIHDTVADRVGPDAVRDPELVTIRPIRPDDRERERRFLANLSRESLYQRLLGARNKLLPGELDRLVDFDRSREAALIATIRSQGAEEQLGVTRYVRIDGGAQAEFAIVVTDAWQRHGLGERLLRCLIATARVQGIETLVGMTFATNKPMLDLARKLGFGVSIVTDDATLRRVAKPLGRFDALPHAPVRTLSVAL